MRFAVSTATASHDSVVALLACETVKSPKVHIENQILILYLEF